MPRPSCFAGLLAPPENWLIWREVTAEAHQESWICRPGATRESLRRAELLAFEFAIDILGMHGGGSEQSLLRDAARLIRAQHQAWNAALPARLAEKLPQLGDERPLLIAGFRIHSPARRVDRRAWNQRLGYKVLRRPVGASRGVVLANDTINGA